MPSPFPGMDPYLEQSAYWSSFHSRLIMGLADAIESVLQAEYYVEVETRTYLSDNNDTVLVGIPDAAVLSSSSEQPTSTTPNKQVASTTAVLTQPQRVTLPIPEEIQERYLEIRDIGRDQVITVIEVLSPKNKRSGVGRTVYETKRTQILASLTHLIEIDFLRSGSPMMIQGQPPEKAYSILVSRSHQRPIADFYGFNLQDAIPSFLLPLKPGIPEPIIDTQAIFNGIYDRARYGSRIDYSQQPPPPQLSDTDQQWLTQLQSTR